MLIRSKAGPDKATPPVVLIPPITFAGFKVTLTRLRALICRLVESELEPTVPVTVIVKSVGTGDVFTEKDAVFDPAGTVTDEGTTASLFEDFSATKTPAVPALEDRVTVPVALVPPSNETGDTRTPLID